MVIVILLFFTAFFTQIQSQSYQVFIDYDRQYQWPPLCLIGKTQSPINIQLSSTTFCPRGLSFNILQLSNFPTLIVRRIQDSKDLQNPFVQQFNITFYQGSMNYSFSSLKLNWHTPSEHAINGKRYDLELQITFTDSNNKIAVMALFFNMVDDNIGRREFDFAALNLTRNTKESFPANLGLLLDNKQLIYYKGSLTSPPCTEGVYWFVYLQPFTINRNELQRIKSIKNNGRPNSRNLQLTNDRLLYLLSQKCFPN